MRKGRRRQAKFDRVAVWTTPSFQRRREPEFYNMNDGPPNTNNTVPVSKQELAPLNVPAHFKVIGTRRGRLGTHRLYMDPSSASTFYYGFVTPPGQNGLRNVDRDVITRSHSTALNWLLPTK